MAELERMTAHRLRELIDGGTRRVVVPFGSVEHQGDHLPLGADALLADAVGRQVAQRLDAVLAPTIRVGSADRHLAATGTISLNAGTLTDLAVDVAGSLAGHGFGLIVFVSTHGGNAAPLRAAVARLRPLLVDAVAMAPQGDAGPQPGTHSGVWLTSVMLALHPDLVELRNVIGDLAAEVREADARTGAANLERFVAGIVDLVRASDAPAG